MSSWHKTFKEKELLSLAINIFWNNTITGWEKEFEASLQIKRSFLKVQVGNG